MGTFRMQADTGERSVLLSCRPLGRTEKEFPFLSSVYSHMQGLFLGSCCWNMLNCSLSFLAAPLPDPVQ